MLSTFDYIKYANCNRAFYENADYSTLVNMYYDAYNQLITVDDYWTGATQYRYNASGSRYMRRTGTQSAVYTLRDGSVSVGEYSGSVGMTNWNILLPSGEIVGRKSYNNSAVYYLKDHLGSTRTAIASTGSIVEAVDYYPFGLEMPGRVTLSGTPALQRFTGYERVDGERFDYAQARWYDPVIGRFMSVDPMAEAYRGWSPYVYSINNPIRFNDPSGLCPEESSSSGNCAGGAHSFLNTIRSTLSGKEMSFNFGALMAGNQALGEIGDEVKGAGASVAKIGVDAGIVLADGVSDGSSIVAGAGVVAAPFTKGASLGVTGLALSVGAVADVTSLSLKAVDYAAFGGSGEAVAWQAGAVALRSVGGSAVQGAASRRVKRTGSAVTGATFRSTQTGRFVSNQYGHTVTAASDATRVVINVTIPNQPIRK